MLALPATTVGGGTPYCNRGTCIVANAEYPLTGNQSAMAVSQSAHPADFLEMKYAYFHGAIDRVLITRVVHMGP
jgi:hypothetical protein